MSYKNEMRQTVKIKSVKKVSKPLRELLFTSRSSRRRKRRLCAACAPDYGFTKNRFHRDLNSGLQTKSLEC